MPGISIDTQTRRCRFAHLHDRTGAAPCVAKDCVAARAHKRGRSACGVRARSRPCRIHHPPPHS